MYHRHCYGGKWTVTLFAIEVRYIRDDNRLHFARSRSELNSKLHPAASAAGISWENQYHCFSPVEIVRRSAAGKFLVSDCSVFAAMIDEKETFSVLLAHWLINLKRATSGETSQRRITSCLVRGFCSFFFFVCFSTRINLTLNGHVYFVMRCSNVL